MITGVNDIELLPPSVDSISITERLSELFSKAKSIRAAIAYWTLSPAKLTEIAGFNAYEILSSGNSFICVDLHLPSNIDHLADLARKGINIYLNIRRLPKKLEKKSPSPGLLHAKLLLVDKMGSDAELWVGSHNWTEYALLGPNIEASIVLHMYNKAPLYSSAKVLLEDIRNTYCRKFDLEKIDYYKKLQQFFAKGDKGKNIIELEGHEVDNLKGKAICIFGTASDDFEAVSKVGNDVLISIHDSGEENIKYLYEAEILHSGRLQAHDPVAGGINITDPRRYAFTEEGRFPYLKKVQEIEKDIYKKAYFFTSIKIKNLKSYKFSLEDVLSRKMPLWASAASDPVEQRMSKVIKDIGSLVLVPADDESAKPQDKSVQLFKSQELSLVDKRDARKYRLISKKLIKYY